MVPELIPVLGSQLQVTWVINPAVGCHYFLPGLQSPSQPLRGLLPCLTMTWLKSCMMTYTGSMWQIEWRTNSVSSCTDVGMARLRSTSWTVAHLHWCCRQAAYQVSHTATDGGPPTSANHCRTPSIRCARPRGLELSAGRPPRTAGLRVLQTGSENLAFLQILACPAH